MLGVAWDSWAYSKFTPAPAACILCAITHDAMSHTQEFQRSPRVVELFSTSALVLVIHHLDKEVLPECKTNTQGSLAA